MKIKTKKQLNLPQLIEWAWDNNIRNQEFICNGFKSKSVIFNFAAYAEFSNEFYYSSDDTFTVEVEEEITEDTLLSKLILIYEGGFIQILENQSINILNKKLVENIYKLNEDLTMTLIWRDGKLIKE